MNRHTLFSIVAVLLSAALVLGGESPSAGVARMDTPPGTNTVVVVPLDPFAAEIRAVLAGQLLAPNLGTNARPAAFREVRDARRHLQLPVGAVLHDVQQCRPRDGRDTFQPGEPRGKHRGVHGETERGDGGI